MEMFLLAEKLLLRNGLGLLDAAAVCMQKVQCNWTERKASAGGYDKQTPRVATCCRICLTA